MCTRCCNSESSDDFAASNSRTPREPLRIRYLMKQRKSDCKTEEEVPTREDASEEATLEENSCSSFRGLPCWSVAGRRVGKNKQSTPSRREYEVEDAAKILLHQRRPLWIESTSGESTNLDPRLDNEAESDTSIQSSNRMEVASSNGDVASREKGKSIMIPASEVDTGTWFLNSTHNAAELEVGHQNGSIASSSTKEDEKSSRELEYRDIYEHTALKCAVNISKLSNMKAKGKGVTTLISGSEINTWSANPIRNVSEWATDDDNDNTACSSTEANKKRKRGSEIKNTSDGNGIRGSYVCNICNESFSTYQALGGHMTCHTEHKSVAAIGTGKEVHRGSVCSKEFATGQKLGGHMRAHYEGALSSAKRVKHNPHTGSSSATARDKAPYCSSSESVNDIAPTASQSVDTTKNSPAAAGSVMTEMVLPHDFNLNELPREGDTPASLSSSEDTPAADSTLDLTLSL